MKIEELPTGKGVADVVFIPNRSTSLPAMIVELKWDQSASAALDQIRENVVGLLTVMQVEIH